ncbi:MAG: amidohydrolase family protein [Thermoplasmata archaeon]|nr:amidohydrolase family protein [Thermoplasmata archaeon]
MAHSRRKRALTVGGMIYAGSGRFFRGYIRIKGNEIVEVNTGTASSEEYTGIVLPKFVNAHTHIGDAVVEHEPRGTLEELVAPPNGLKFRILAEKSVAEKIAAMRRCAKVMEETTCLFVDFREEGIAGTENLGNAVMDLNIKAKIFGRPLKGDLAEIRQLLKICDGIGMSAVSDWDYGYLSRLSAMAKDAGKMFALHASERVREDIQKVLSLNPDFVVHMCRADPEDFAACAAKKVAIVVCPRSNLLFGNFPDVRRMLDEGVDVMLGTDNAMFNSPSIFREMEFLYKCRLKGYIEPEKILPMVIDTPAKFFLGKKSYFARGTKPDLIVLALPLTDPAYQVVARAGEHLVEVSF